MIGTSLGPYKILEQLGAGGMGEVWLAEDTRLNRKVAVKVLPAEFASDPERLARFEQEAKAAAALNHPHIAVVHDVGSAVAEGDGPASGSADEPVVTHYMVQEYLEGQSLRERLDRGALPLDNALALAMEVGEALVAAHKAGIVHRDLKPDNIFVTEQGHAKVLDFGLAKLTEVAAPVGSSASMSPTMLGTVAGQVMGTAGYMAPEQVNGEEVDARADLFSFGAVFYEMVTGRRAFAGDNIHETLSRIISKPPQAVHEIRNDLPLKLGWIVDKALAKDVGRRYQTATGFNADLAQLQEDIVAGVAVMAGGSEAGEAAAAVEATAGMGWRLAVPLVVATAGLTALLVWFGTRPAPPEPQAIMHLGFDLPEGVRPNAMARHALTLSDNGRWLVFQADRQLYLHEMATQEAAPIRGTDIRATNPFFSPGGEWVGFWGGDTQQLYKIPVQGGAPTPLCADRGNLYGAHWAADGTIVFGQGRSGIWQVSENGESCSQLVEVEDGWVAHGPQLLPGGRAVLFTLRRVGTSYEDAEIVVHSLDTGDRTSLKLRGADARYLPTGHIVYGSGGVVWAVSFDPERLEVTSPAQPVIEDVRHGSTFDTASPGPGTMHFAFSQQGTLVYLKESAALVGGRELVWVDPETGDQELVTTRERGLEPRLSFDETKIAVAAPNAEGLPGVWFYDLVTGNWTLLTTDGPGEDPVWSFDDAYIYFSADRGSGVALWRRRWDMVGPAEQVWAHPEHSVFPDSVSRDGRFLYYTSAAPGVAVDLVFGTWVVDLETEPPVGVQLGSPMAGAMVHPSGRWLAYDSRESGDPRTFVRALIDGELGRQYTISEGEGYEPKWSRDGTTLYYREFLDSDRLMAVDFQTEAEFGPTQAREVMAEFPALRPAIGRGDYDVREDGRFLTVVAGDRRSEQLDEAFHIEVIVDWFEDLKAKVPPGGGQ